MAENQTARERAEAIIDSLEFQDGERDELVPIVERAITAAEQAAFQRGAEAMLEKAVMTATAHLMRTCEHQLHFNCVAAIIDELNKLDPPAPESGGAG